MRPSYEGLVRFCCWLLFVCVSLSGVMWLSERGTLILGFIPEWFAFFLCCVLLALLMNGIANLQGWNGD